MRRLIAIVPALLIAVPALAVDPAKYPPRQRPQPPVRIDAYGGAVDVRTPGADVRVHPRPVLFPLLNRLFAPRVQIQVRPPRQRPQRPPCTGCEPF